VTGREVDDDLVMDALATKWDGYYKLEVAEDGYHAYRLVPLTADTPGGLDSAIRADFSRWRTT
jgi:hypothetical protein